MARISVLAQFFPPETNAAARRLEPFLDALARSHEITVTTLRPSYPEPELYADGAAAASDANRPYRIRRTITFRPHPRRLAVRAVREQAMAATLLLAAARDRVDIVLTSSPSMFLGPAGWALARANRARFVLDLRDLHWRLARELAADRTGRVTGLALRGLERHMWSIVKRADLIVSATPGITTVLLAEGVPERKILTLPNTISQEVLGELEPCADRGVERTAGLRLRRRDRLQPGARGPRRRGAARARGRLRDRRRRLAPARARAAGARARERALHRLPRPRRPRRLLPRERHPLRPDARQRLHQYDRDPRQAVRVHGRFATDRLRRHRARRRVPGRHRLRDHGSSGRRPGDRSGGRRARARPRATAPARPQRPCVRRAQRDARADGRAARARARRAAGAHRDVDRRLLRRPRSGAQPSAWWRSGSSSC